MGKRSKSCYHYQITILIKDKLSLHALKYMYSKATYVLSHTISQCSKWGKRTNSCYNDQITLLVKDRLCALKYVYSQQLTDWVWVNHIIWRCSKWEKGATHVTIIRSLHSSRILCTQIIMSTQRQLTDWVWVNHTISQCSKGEKGKKSQKSSKFDVVLCYTVKYIHSEVTYHPIWVTELLQLTSSQTVSVTNYWGNGSKHH